MKNSESLRPGFVALLLFGSGFSALVYQTVWLRELRLIFGSSTPATAAVLAIFMGGLGAGGLLLGPRADRSPNPLRFYAALELSIALLAALTPLLLVVVEKLYILTGGSSVLGASLATLVRLTLALLVFAAPTFLMGGTLPAAIRAVERNDDPSRKAAALLYGLNTLGAVTGAALSTFLLLELLGNRRTLFVAALLNMLVAVTARALSRRFPEVSVTPADLDRSETAVVDDIVVRNGTAARPGFVLLSAAVVGFAFLLMELVWYRMLSPLLGGSTFTFGMILAVALLGIGLGGAAYSLFASRTEATLSAFALTCSLEAVFVAVPLALGDRVAVVTLMFRALTAYGFVGSVISWFIVTALVVLPASFVAGVQFPLLIALLGRGRDEVGRQVGLAYAWNTLGSIAGSLAGGFGLMPLLTAPGCWRFTVVMLVSLAVAAVLTGASSRRLLSAAPVALSGLSAILMLFMTGPTAVWRHTPIGAGRATLPHQSRNALHEWESSFRRTIAWEADGRESSVALSDSDGYAFLISGKSDGHARIDAGTQVMSGLIGSLFVSNPRTAMVIGLGTGSTGGWLAALPTMDHVDVVELEPAIQHVAEVCSPVNSDAMKNPRMHLSFGDAREVLLTSRQKYDLIFSEPSNPFRAGIASLFTNDFYRAVSRRLKPQGVFVQWVQAYEIDSRSIRTVYGTISDVFPHVQTWQTRAGDLILIASPGPLALDADELRRRIAQPPIRAALVNVWRVTDLEGLLSHFVARDSFASRVSRTGAPHSSDDHNFIEFGFARGVGRDSAFDASELWNAAGALGEDTLIFQHGSINSGSVRRQRILQTVIDGLPWSPPNPTPEETVLGAVGEAYAARNFPLALSRWATLHRHPSNLLELSMVANMLSNEGLEAAEPYIQNLRMFQPTEAEALTAELRWKQGRFPEAGEAITRAFQQYRTDPWPSPKVMAHALETSFNIARDNHAETVGRSVFQALREPYAVHMLNAPRHLALLSVAELLDRGQCGEATMVALSQLEPAVPWQKRLLLTRARCYAIRRSPLANRAAKDLAAFLAEEPESFVASLRSTAEN